MKITVEVPDTLVAELPIEEQLNGFGCHLHLKYDSIIGEGVKVN